MTEIVVTSVTVGLPGQRLPLGGGEAVMRQLIREWMACGRFDVTVLGIGGGRGLAGARYVRLPVCLPGQQDLTNLSESDYARMARDFERAATEHLRSLAKERDSGRICIVCNDVAEGPDFRAIAQMGFPIVTIFHVDVVDFFRKFYLRGFARPGLLTAGFRRLERVGVSCLLPHILQLVFRKQEDCVRHSSRLIVPSMPMAEILARCYPTNPAERVAVIPWGVWPTEPIPETEVHAECERQRSELALAPDDLVLLTLSRLSPEKGIDLLLEALRLWEAEGGQPPPTADSRTPPGPAGFHNESSSLVRRLRLLICGEAAYMRGQAFVGKLKRQAARLRQVRVSFLGHVSGVRKRALFGLAHLYVFPSRHESYGLTLVEAMAAGLPVLTSNHYSARETVPPDCGLIASWQRESEAPHALKEALNALLADPARLRLMGQAAARRARAIPFSTAAEAVAATIDAAMGSRPT